VLGLLQYRWLGRVSEADADQAKKRVDRQAAQFAEEFNREIQSAYFNLQLDAENLKARNWQAFNERFDFFLENAKYPEIIAEIYVQEAETGAGFRFDRTAREFVPSEPKPEIAALRATFPDSETFGPVYTEPLTLVLPVREMPQATNEIRVRRREPGDITVRKMAPNSGILFISLDQAIVKNRMLPDLAEKYFGDGEFQAAVVSNNGTPVFRSARGSAPDATAKLLDLAPDTFMFFGNRELLSVMRHPEPPLEKVPGANSVVNSRIEAHSFSRIEGAAAPNGAGTIELKVQRSDEPKTAVFSATTSAGPMNPWQLRVQHAYGSIDAYAAATLRRNLILGFGLLLLVAAAAAAIIISAQRARILAQRQVDFVSSVSHEFRTPLAVIYSAGENLADGVTRDPEQIHRYGDLIKGEGRKLSAMVEQILEFAGAKGGRRRFNISAVEVDAIVDSAISECEPLIRESGVEVEKAVAEKLPPVQADPAAISQAVQNLIANSVKYGGEKGRIRVIAENGGGTVKISVEDSGIGISPGDLKQIFQPFYRAKNVVDAQIHGNGLGLSIVKQIADGHGGKVTAVSEVGKGSRFTIELKAAG
jgi:signal transduction histidine kinase